jgi:hypothetical protein
MECLTCAGGYCGSSAEELYPNEGADEPEVVSEWHWDCCPHGEDAENDADGERVLGLVASCELHGSATSIGVFYTRDAAESGGRNGDQGEDCVDECLGLVEDCFHVI